MREHLAMMLAGWDGQWGRWDREVPQIWLESQFMFDYSAQRAGG